MSLIQYLLPAAIAASSSVRVTLSGETVNETDVGGPYNTAAGIIVNADGTVDKYEGSNGPGIRITQIDAATDWIIPNGAASSDYEVRVTNVNHNGGPGWNTSPGADGDWFALSEDRAWTIRRTTVGSDTTNFDIEIRKNGGPTLASGSYTATVNNEV